LSRPKSEILRSPRELSATAHREVRRAAFLARGSLLRHCPTSSEQQTWIHAVARLGRHPNSGELQMWRCLQSQATLPVQMYAATIGLAVIGCYVLIHLLALSTLFYRPEAANLGDLMRLLVRTGEQIIISPGFSLTIVDAPDNPKSRLLFLT